MSFQDLDLKVSYKTNEDDVVRDFFIPTLSNSVLYQRCVGYFSSSALANVTKGVYGLIKNNGKIQLVASPKLSEEDVKAIDYGYMKREEIIEKTLIKSLTDTTCIEEIERLNFLANLIAEGYLDIKIAVMTGTVCEGSGLGMYHEKSGVMYDAEGNCIAFTGSNNATHSGQLLNMERLTIFTEWNGTKLFVDDLMNDFTKLWDDKAINVKVESYPNVNKEIVKKFKTKDLDLPNIPDSENMDNKFTEKEEQLVKNAPKMPDNINLYDYQLEAIENWKNKGYRGIFDMATGTGKTFTALGAITSLSSSLKHKLGIVIVCPYRHLVDQWAEDAIKFNMKPIIAYGATGKNWRKELEKAIKRQKILDDHAFYCVIVTNSTFAKNDFQNMVRKTSSNLLLVADEAHNLGATTISKNLDDKYQYRLALSATINRHCDEEGTNKLFDYFGSKCIEYSLERAIKEGYLTKYYYYPIVVNLTLSEFDKYKDLSKDLRDYRNFITKNGKTEYNDRGKMIAIERARVVAGAENKLNALREAIEPYKDKNKILVYCGATNVEDINSLVDDSEMKQINAVTSILGNEYNMNVSKFTAEEDMPTRRQLINDFSDGSILQALAAIKCLDEGVNIPSIKTAFILASTTNPKEYIQRRGRVLRLSEGKEFAEIYDFVTVPFKMDFTQWVTDEDIELSKTLVLNELRRIYEFSRLSENEWDSIDIYNKLQMDYKITDREIMEENHEKYSS